MVGTFGDFRVSNSMEIIVSLEAVMLRALLNSRLPITALTFLGAVTAVCERLPGMGAERSGISMVLEAQLDGVTAFKTKVPVCRAEPGRIIESPRKTFSFSIKPKRSILWMRELGHTVTPITTKPNQEIDVLIWTYCTEDNDPCGSSVSITISGSFSTGEKPLRNMIHLAHPKRRDRSDIATGLSILTYPAQPGE